MAWFADLAGKAESLLNNLDEQTGAALRNNVPKRTEIPYSPIASRTGSPKRRKSPKKTPPAIDAKSSPRRIILNSKQCDKDIRKETKARSWKASSSMPYSLENYHENLVGDMMHNNICGLRQRRLSLPTGKELQYTYAVQKVEVENTMLKNELNVLHKEVSQLLDRLKKTEDGNDVVSDQELSLATAKLTTAENVNRKDHSDRMALSDQFEELKQKVHNLTVAEMEKQKKLCRDMQLELDLHKKRNQEFEEIIRELHRDNTEYKNHQMKADKDLKHAQTVISELENNLEKTTAECRRLEKDWEAYKLRVKSMLNLKDKEIKQLQEGLNLTEDTKILIEQLEALREEREELSEKVSKVRSESGDLKRQVEELEARYTSAERVVGALREALKDERTAKLVADGQVTALTKELKTLQTETNQTIFSLHESLRQKDNEICRLKEEVVHSTNTSALNVADYDDQASIDGDKIRYLTQTLVQRQGKIDMLLADNNMLKIQIAKMESKYKAELSAIRTHSNHSMVQVQDDGRSRRARHGGDFMRGLSLRLGPLFRYPVFRMFLLFYMLGLHIWVITVLLTSTPDILTRRGPLNDIDKNQPFQT